MLCYCALRDREKLKTGFKRLLTIDVPGEEDERYMVTDVSVTHTCTLALYKSKRLQWNFSIEDTTGTQLAVLYQEVSLIQRQICTQLYVVGTAGSVLIREVSPIQSVLNREVHCIHIILY